MYNGAGLNTARGSGTNGYVQTNKFHVRPKMSRDVMDGVKRFGSDQGEPNWGWEILEHERKRQIELQLVILEDKLIDEGLTDAQIAQKVDELRVKLEAEAVDVAAGAMDVSDMEVLDTQTHQVAARKQKQMEKLRVALGITSPDGDMFKHGEEK